MLQNNPDFDIEALKALQVKLSRSLVLYGDLSNSELIAGADTSSDSPFALKLPNDGSGMINDNGKNKNLIHSAVVIWHRTKKKVVDHSVASIEVSFPYIPGLLAFRELPALLEAFRHLKVKPDAIIVDGQGIAHPRHFGIACHLGLELNIPTVGCAKTRLYGNFKEPADVKGEWSPLLESIGVGKEDNFPKIVCNHSNTNEIGRVLRTRTGVKPVFISPGHLCDAENAIKLVLTCCTRYRLPEPIRAAHKLANEVRHRQIKKFH